MLLRVLAQNNIPIDVVNPVNALAITNISDIFGLIINIVIGVAVGLTIIFLVMCGIQYITAKGDSKAADAARTACTNAIIGFIIAVAGVTIKVAIANTLNVDTSSLNSIVPL